ncbi:hypothetical protein KVM24_02430 [Helicobacter pylori]|nr:hypothetical protein KVM24_02430 [Helicobacter pylori]
MAYFESITAGRGGLEGFNQALNNQRYANLVLNESMGNFANTIANAGSLFDNAKIREEALRYQKMRDLANDKKQAEAFELQKRQAEQSMDFAKRQHVLNEEAHRQNKRLNDQREQAMKLENRLNQKQHEWLMKTIPPAKASVLVKNEAKRAPTPTTPKANNTPITPIIPKKTITKEEFKALYANPMFRY